MGYRIQYQPELNNKYLIKSKRKTDKQILLYISILSCLAILLTVPVCRHWLWEFLIPGDAQLTSAAFSEMLNLLKSGEDLSDAVTAFCKEILVYA